jgi:hypothetical protein
MKKLLPVMLLLLSITCFGQDFRQGKVSRAELEQKFHPADTSAPAAILYKKGQTYFTLDIDGYWTMVTDVEYRIKIYKKEGYKYATDKLTYYTGGKTVKAFYSEASTYNLVNGEIERTKLKGDGEFKEKVEENYSQRTITLPNVKEGSVIEYKYTIVTPYTTVFRDWFFQYGIPANFVSYEIAIPLYFNYNRVLSGYVKVDQTEPKVRIGQGGRFNESVITFSAKDIKAIREENYVNNLKNYTSILMHELASTHFPSGTEEYATTWESVTKRIYDDDDFGKELRQASYFKDDLALLPLKQGTQAEKADMIVRFVRSRMNWDGEASYYCTKGVRKAYEDKTGNSAEINLMLTAMLREAGLPANPVLVSTRSNGVAMFPNRAAYNYVVAGIENGKEVILVDATSKYSPAGILPLRALNWEGRMIRSDGSSLKIDLMPDKASRDITSITATIGADGTVSGRAREQHYDYYGYIFREKNAGLAAESHVEKKEKKFGNIEITDYSVENVNDLSKPASENYSFVHTGSAEVVGDKLYLDPMLFFTMGQNPFTKETREYPVDFGFPYQDRYVFTLTLPEGYEVDHLPKPVAINMEENIGSFKFNSASKGNVIQLGISLEINFANVSQSYYATLRDFFAKVVEKQNEKIVLQKK